MNSDKIQVKEHPKEHKEITDYINFFLSLDFHKYCFPADVVHMPKVIKSEAI